MTTKTINTYIAAGYRLSSTFSRLVITTTGGIGGAGLYAGSHAQIFNDGVVHGAGAVGIILNAGGLIQNGDTAVTGALIEGTFGVIVNGAAGTVNNFGTISGSTSTGVSMGAGGTVTNTGAASLISGATGVYIVGAGLVINGGTIAAAAYSGVGLGAGGSVANTGTITAASNGQGVYLNGGGAVSNTGAAALIKGANGVDVVGGAGLVTNTGVISGTSGAGVLLNAGGAVTNTGTAALINGANGVFVNGAAGTVANYGTIDGLGGTLGNAGVFLAEGGTVTNGAAGDTTALIEGDSGVIGNLAIASVINYGTILGQDLSHSGAAVVLNTGGQVRNGTTLDTGAFMRGDTGVFVAGGAGTVVNYGTIVATKNPAAGIDLTAGGSVTNGAAGDTTALIEGTYGVVTNGGAGTVANFGAIEATSVGVVLESGGKVTNGTGKDKTAVISGYDGLFLDGASTVINSGTIEGAGTGALGNPAYGVLTSITATGVVMTNGSKTNTTALIEGHGGVELRGVSTAVNFGTILATGTAGGVGVYMVGPGTVTNFGTIKAMGGQAVLFKSAADVLVVEAGSVFDGSIDGGGGTLTLANGTGILAGLLAGGSVTVSGSMAATLFSDFATVSIGAKAKFATSGAVTIAAGQGVIDAGTLVLGAAKATLVNAGLIETTGAGVLTLKGVVANSGTLSANGGTFTVNGAVSGTGAATINGGTLDFLSAFNEGVTFTGKAGVLELARSQAFTATIAGFSKTGGTSLDLADIAFVSASEATFAGTKAGGVLTVTDGTHTAHIHLTGNYLSAVWVASSDGHGGVSIVDPPAAAAAAAPPPHQFIAAMAGLGGAGAAPLHIAVEPWRSPPFIGPPRIERA